MTSLSILMFVVAALTPPSLASPAQSATQVTREELQLVVFNRPGPYWEHRGTALALLVAHQQLYRGLAESGAISFSGRSADALLGLSIFAPGVDAAAMRRRLEADPAVTGGFVALEFHTFVRNFASANAKGGR